MLGWPKKSYIRRSSILKLDIAREQILYLICLCIQMLVMFELLSAIDGIFWWATVRYFGGLLSGGLLYCPPEDIFWWAFVQWATVRWATVRTPLPIATVQLPTHRETS